MVTTLTLCGIISYCITVYIVKSVFQCYKERWQTLNYHVLNVVISLHSQMIVAHNLVTDDPSRLRILLQHFSYLPRYFGHVQVMPACLVGRLGGLCSCYVAIGHLLLQLALMTQVFILFINIVTVNIGSVHLLQPRFTFSMFFQLLRLSAYTFRATESLWEFTSSSLYHGCDFFCSHCTEQENCLQYLYRVTCIFCLHIYDSIFKHTKTQTLFETCLPDKSNCHCVCCLPPLLHLSP